MAAAGPRLGPFQLGSLRNPGPDECRCVCLYLCKLLPEVGPLIVQSSFPVCAALLITAALNRKLPRGGCNLHHASCQVSLASSAPCNWPQHNCSPLMPKGRCLQQSSSIRLLELEATGHFRPGASSMFCNTSCELRRNLNASERAAATTAWAANSGGQLSIRSGCV